MVKHRFTPEETIKGASASAKARKVANKIAKKAQKLTETQMYLDLLKGALNPQAIPYIAAFMYGAMAGNTILANLDKRNVADMTPKDIALRGMTDIQFGMAGIMAYGMAVSPSQASLAGNVTQIMGAGVLGGLGLGAIASTEQKDPVTGELEPKYDLFPQPFQLIWESIWGAFKPKEGS